MFLATHGTCPTLARAILEGVARYTTCARQQLPPPPINTTDHLSGFQTRIGWQHIFRGFFPAAWTNHQANYEYTVSSKIKSGQSTTGMNAYLVQKFSTKTHKRTWGDLFAQQMLTYSHTTWAERCEQAHHRTSRFETEHQRTRAIALVQSAYKHRENVSAEDSAAIFDETLEDKLNFHEATSLIAWHTDIKPVLKIAIKEYAQALRKQKAKITFKQRATATKNNHKKRYQLRSNNKHNNVTIINSPKRVSAQDNSRNTEPADNNNPT